MVVSSLLHIGLSGFFFNFFLYNYRYLHIIDGMYNLVAAILTLVSLGNIFTIHVTCRGLPYVIYYQLTLYTQITRSIQIFVLRVNIHSWLTFTVYCVGQNRPAHREAKATIESRIRGHYMHRNIVFCSQ